MPCDPCSVAIQNQLKAISRRLSQPIFGAIVSQGCKPDDKAVIPYSGDGVYGLSSQLNAISKQIDIVRKQICEDDCGSVLPAHWNVPPGKGIPQLILLLAPLNPKSGGLARADTSLVVPHWQLGKEETRKQLSIAWIKGQYLGRILFEDGSRIIGYFDSKDSAKAKLRYLAQFCSQNIAQEYYADVPTAKPVGSKAVNLKYAKFYGSGRENVQPDWSVSFV